LKRNKFSGTESGVHLPWPYNENKSKYIVNVDLTSTKGNYEKILKRNSFDSEIPIERHLGRKSRITSVEQMRNGLPRVSEGDKA